MKTRYLFMIATLGLVAGVASMIAYNQKIKPQQPLAVSYNPYEKGVYATGIVESDQVNGSNVNIYSEVSSRITNIMVKNGQAVKKGMPLLTLDDSVQQGTIAKDLASIRYSKASLVNVQEQLAKLQKAVSINPKSISRNDLDNAINAVKIAKESLSVAEGQYQADKALLDKYTIYSPIDGIVLRVVPAIGDYSEVAVGSFDPYSQGFLPPLQLGVTMPSLQVRTYVDEILIPQLPHPSKLEATLFVRGMQNKSIPLTFVSLQPSTIPNIELSNERNERVDVRVLPILFSFEKPHDINIYPGQLVDVYIKGKL